MSPVKTHPRALDLVNPRRAWFTELCRYTNIPSWDDYRARYFAAQCTFNVIVEHEPERAFMEIEWCLLRQPFRHRWTQWDHVLQHMPKDEWGAILDYGCGTGEMLTWLKRRRPIWLYDGIDLDSPQLAYARWRGFGAPNRHYRYDVVTCYETLEHLPNPVRAVEEMLEYLRPGGVLLWDFIDDYEGGNVATREARREVLRMLGGTTGQREMYRA